MNNINYIKQFFVRQFDHNDCGLACLQMILNYAGKSGNELSFHEPLFLKDNGLSLLQLRELATHAGLKARCVELDINWMRTNKVPCILHMVKADIGNHFQVCFGVRKKSNRYEYLLADPAGKVYFLAEPLLEKQWQSKAALYFDALPAPGYIHCRSSWQHLLSMGLFPKALWVSIPLLNICSVALGIAISWVLERGMEDSLANKKQSLIVAIIFLLFAITIFKSLMSYVRQRVLISLNNKINSRLVDGFIRNILIGSSPYPVVYTERFIKSQMAEIQKIQNAGSVFVSIILSDGSLLLMVCSGLLYLSWFAGVINLLYLLLLGSITFKKQQGISLAYANLYELLGAAENCLLTDVKRSKQNYPSELNPENLKLHEDNHERYLKNARALAIKISKINFWYECIGTTTVILVFTDGIIELQRQSISYGTFIIWVLLSYLITSLMPKICNAFYVLTEGAEAACEYRQSIRQRS